jgi:hypothetical protein
MLASRTIRIFVSTVSDEFRTYRDRLRSDLTRPDVEVKVQEDFTDQGGVTLENLDVYIKACDAVVHLVGDMAGAAAGTSSTKAILAKYPDLPRKLPPLGEALGDGVPVSYTQWEAWLALYHDKVLLITRADSDASRGPAYAPTEASRAAQQAHLARLAAVERYPGRTFTSPDSLASQIAHTTVLDLLAKAQSKGGKAAGTGVTQILGPVVLGVLGAFGAWLAVGSAALGHVQILLIVAIGLAFAAVPIVYNYNLGVLAQGTAPKDSVERRDYERLRASLEGENLAARLYASWLAVFLDWIDRFFGDEGMADRTLFPHAFGLRTPVPLWTAPAFDRCLFLALIYPVVTIFLIWTISGQVGPAEAALGLQADLPGWARAFAVVAVVVQGIALWRFTRKRSIVRLAVACIAAVAFAVAFALAFNSLGTGIVALAGAVGFAVAGAGRVAGAIIAGIAVAFSWAFAVAGTDAVVFALVLGAVGTVVAAILLICAVAIKLGRQGVFLALFVPASVVACLSAAEVLARLPTWKHTGPLGLFLVLLTFVSAPFNWASLGLTRALLRRGLELKGWWPYLLGLVDASLAGVIVSLLAITMLVAVQAYNLLSAHGGGAGAVVLPVDTLIDGIAQSPAEPEYWWVYALLLSTMISSLTNLAIGGMALTRGIPWLARLVVQWVPEDGDLPDYKRQPVAIGLTVQMFSGAILGIAAQALLAWALLFHIMPLVGLNLLDMARAVAAFDLPAKIGALFAAVW